jgi:hypothetical protein
MQYSKSSPHLEPLVEQQPVRDMAVLAVAKRATKLQTLANPRGAMAKRSPSSLQRERESAHAREPRKPFCHPVYDDLYSIRSSISIHFGFMFHHIVIRHSSRGLVLIRWECWFIRVSSVLQDVRWISSCVWLRSALAVWPGTWPRIFSQPGESFLLRGSFHPPRGLALVFIHCLDFFVWNSRTL